MKLSELFEELSTRGLTVFRNGTALRCCGDQSLLTSDLKAGLRTHRGQLLAVLPDTKNAVRDRMTALVDWLNRAAPDSYQLDEPFWLEFDRELEAAIGTGDLTQLDETIDRLKHRAAAHFAPFHKLPAPGGTVVHFPDHELLAFSWEREAIGSVEAGGEVNCDWP